MNNLILNSIISFLLGSILMFGLATNMYGTNMSGTSYEVETVDGFTNMSDNPCGTNLNCYHKPNGCDGDEGCATVDCDDSRCPFEDGSGKGCSYCVVPDPIED